MSQSQYDADYNLQENDNIIELIPKIRLDIVKEIYESIGYSFGKTDNVCNYRNYLINDLELFGDLSGLDNEYANLTIGGGKSVISLNNFQQINVDAFKKYASGGYLNNIMNNINARTINFRRIPNNFITTIQKVSEQTNVPVGFFVLVAASEGSFNDRQTNSSGYGGYFGQSTKAGVGYGAPLEVQAAEVAKTYKIVKSLSPGAGYQDLLVLGYIYHHLPAVGSKYWKQTNGKIYSLDPDYIYNNIKACYSGGSATRYAEAITVNVVAQYLSAQICSAGI